MRRPQTHAVDQTVVYLAAPGWRLLLDLTTRAYEDKRTGGWQARLLRWRGRMDRRTRSVLLSHTPTSSRALDDMEFIARAIRQRDVGGWQKHAYDIFAGAHPRFTGIEVLPRKPKAPRPKPAQGRLF